MKLRLRLLWKAALLQVQQPNQPQQIRTATTILVEVLQRKLMRMIMKAIQSRPRRKPQQLPQNLPQQKPSQQQRQPPLLLRQSETTTGRLVQRRLPALLLPQQLRQHPVLPLLLPHPLELHLLLLPVPQHLLPRPIPLFHPVRVQHPLQVPIRRRARQLLPLPAPRTVPVPFLPSVPCHSPIERHNCEIKYSKDPIPLHWKIPLRPKPWLSAGWMKWTSNSCALEAMASFRTSCCNVLPWPHCTMPRPVRVGGIATLRDLDLAPTVNRGSVTVVNATGLESVAVATAPWAS
mmetsp:Transcript_24327/g.67414  ORF Transcript_24327/g.67414 Transcript_24327/m.67414 type:complete len:291 (+) Transcript_24327:473-1345(+)